MCRPAHPTTMLVALIIAIIASSPARASLREINAAIDAGDYQPALHLIDRQRRLHPSDVDYAFARARVLVRLGRDAEALDELDTALKLAPDYEDVWALRYTILSRQPGPAAAAELVAVRKEAARRFPDSGWWRPGPAENDIDWILLLGAAHDSLNNGLPDWNNQFVELSRARAGHSRYTLRMGRDQRFAGSDLSFGVAAERSWASGWFAGADIMLADDPAFLPDYGYTVHAGRSLVDGWVVDVAVREREYATTSVGSAITTIEKYVGDFRFAYGLSVSRLEGSSSFLNHALTANWYYRENSSIGVTANTGKEAESIGPGLVLETDVEGISVSGRQRLNDRLDLHWWLGVHDQGDLYRRRFIGMAVSIRI